MPVIPGNIYRLVFSGTLGPDVDEWQVRLHGQVHVVGIEPNWQQDYVNAAADAWGSRIMESTAPVFTATDTVLTGVSLYKLDTSGHTEFIWPADPDHVNVAGTGGDSLPSEVAVCVSLETGILGRSYRGRSYLPGLAKAACGADGTINTTYYEHIADRYADLVTALDSHLDGGDSFINIGILSETKGIFTEVIGVKAGNVFDVQRRRRNGGPEVYSLSSVTPVIGT